jgi:hypothetical protein
MVVVAAKSIEVELEFEVLKRLCQGDFQLSLGHW